MEYPKYTQYGNHHAQLMWTGEREITFDDVITHCPDGVIPIRLVYTGVACNPTNFEPRPYVRFEIARLRVEE